MLFRILYLLVMLALLLSVSCRFLGGASTPEEAVRRSVQAMPGSTGPVQIVSTRSWDRGKVALYRTTHTLPDQDQPMPIFGYVLLEQRWNGWSSTGGGASSSGAMFPPNQLISYGTGSGTSDETSYTIVDGEVLSPEVYAVEADFANGQTLRDETTDDVFAMVIAEQTTPCALRVLGAGDQLLERIDLAHMAEEPHACGS